MYMCVCVSSTSRHWCRFRVL